jgi:hypothetical protein
LWWIVYGESTLQRWVSLIQYFRAKVLGCEKHATQPTLLFIERYRKPFMYPVFCISAWMLSSTSNIKQPDPIGHKKSPLEKVHAGISLEHHDDGGLLPRIPTEGCLRCG